MLDWPDHRVCLTEPPTVSTEPELEAVFVGAAAATPVFAAATTALAAASQLGFVPAPDDTTLTGLPLAFTTATSFAAVFPGDESWLARAVRDYFNTGGLRAWVVRVEVDPTDPLDAYVRLDATIGASAALAGGVAIAMQVPSAGLLVLPDLEHLCLAAALPPPPLPVAPPVPPGFRPLADFATPSASSAGSALPPNSAIAPHDVLGRISTALAAERSDMLCLFALPIGADQTQSLPALVARADAYVHGDTSPGADLPQVQVFAPLMLDASGDVATPSGVIAGTLAATAQSDGVWRSITGQTLPLGGTPLRRIESNALDALRKCGIAVLRFAPGGTVLDDDILACRDSPANALRRAGGTRRLMGWLVRNLQSFGEQLVFENVLDDGRVELILTDLFADLLARGALNGRQVTDAVQITRRNPEEGALEFDIAIAMAVAVETIRLSFVDGELTTTLGVAA